MKVVTTIDSQTIESLFQDHYEGLCRYAFSILKNQDEAEDVVQKLFLKIWEKRKELEIQSYIKSYLFRAVYNSSLNELKRINKKSMQEELENLPQLKTDDSEPILYQELEGRIEEALQTLPEKCGEVFQLSRFKDLSYKEISEQLNISIKTVENHMGKALKMMRMELQDYLPAIIITLLLLKKW